MNVVALSGNIATDIELRTTQDNVSVCFFAVAVHRPGTKDKTDFINCVAWAANADFLSRYFSKGKKIAVSGCLATRKWSDKQGNSRTSVEVVVNDISFGENTAAASGTSSGLEAIENDEDEYDLPY